MANVEVQVEQWQERGIQVMVVLSFMMQLTLLVLAEFRRRMDSGALRAMVWSAYMLADSTAIYTLGHLSVTSRSSNHELMAFWAPFLLVHLGGQDNITAYAIKDNRLWLRHLQTLVVQVAAAAYILYESTIVGTEVLLRIASVLMFVVGVLKYKERVWALKRAGTSALGRKYKDYRAAYVTSRGPPTHRRDIDGLLLIAHLMLDIPKNMFQGPLSRVEVHMLFASTSIHVNDLYKVVEMQLSLMHDIVYSKAEVVHTWYGLCIRGISSVFTVVAFVLFHRLDLSVGDHHQYSRADIVITYVLLGGAVMLEMVSVLRVMFSRWPSMMLGRLAYNTLGDERFWWGFLSRGITSILRFVLPERDGSRWWWSGSMGQHNLIDMCVGSRTSRGSRMASWMGVEDWWNTKAYSWSIPVSTTIKELVLEQVQRSIPGKKRGLYASKYTEEKPDHIINSQGRASLKKWGLYEKIGKFVEMELDEIILVWHIATHIYLRWRKDQGQYAADDVCPLTEATEAISNYMVFLLAARPYMLPNSVSRSRYVHVCYTLTTDKYSAIHDLGGVLMSPRLTSPESSPYPGTENIEMNWLPSKHIFISDGTLKAARDLASELVAPESGTPTELRMLAEVWTEILCYAGYRCSGYNHTKQLSNGGELLTVAALVVEYYRRGILEHTTETGSPGPYNDTSSSSSWPSCLGLDELGSPSSLRLDEPGRQAPSPLAEPEISQV